METLRKLAVPLVVIALVTAAAVTMFTGSDSKRLVAHFPRTISVYEGSEVRVLGVPIGAVESVEPSGTDVVVTMTYDSEVELPADAKAAIVAPSIVGDRYVQVTPVYTGGEVMADGVELPVEQTAVPIELDQIYESLDTLNVALGPNGANRNGALSDLLAVTADNFDGQGADLRSTLGNFARLTATLDNNKEELFGSAEQLGKFISTLAENDQTVRSFNQSLVRRVRPPRGREGGALGLPAQPVGGAHRGVVVRQGQPRGPGPQHLRAQPGVQGAGQAARRARRDPQGRARSRSTTSR